MRQLAADDAARARRLAGRGKGSMMMMLLFFTAWAAAAAAAETNCSVQIVRVTPGKGTIYLNLNEVELLSSAVPVVKITPTTFRLSSTWSAAMAVGKCFDGQVSNTTASVCATSYGDTNATLTITYPCTATLVAVRVWNRIDCCATRIDAFQTVVTGADGVQQTTRFLQLGSGLPVYTFPVTATTCSPSDPCAGTTCPNATECQASVSCVAGSCVATNKANGTLCSNSTGSCTAGTCTALPLCLTSTTRIVDGVNSVVTTIAGDYGSYGCSYNSANVVAATYVAKRSGSHTFATCGSAGDTTLNVYTCSRSSCLGSNDDNCGAQSSVAITAVAGTQYLVIAGGYTTADVALGATLKVTVTPPA